MRTSLASATSLLALLLLDGQREAVATPVVSVSQPATFGYQLVGATSASVSSLVTVSGQTAGTYLTVSAASSPFGGTGLDTSISSTSTTSSSVSFTFTPIATGLVTQTINATDTSSGSNTAKITLSGTGVAPVVSGPAGNVSVSNYVLVGQTGSVSLSVANTGNAYLAAASKTVNNTSYNLNGSISAASNSVFVGTAASISLQDSNYTGTGAKTSATYAYTFTPTITGTQTATVTTKFSDGGGTTNAATTVTSTLVGTAVAPVQSVANTSTTVYGRIGSGSVINTAVTVANIGNGNLAGTGTLYNLNGSVTNTAATGIASTNTGTISLASNATASANSTATTTLGYTYTPGSARATSTSAITLAFSNGNSAGTNVSQSVAATITGQAVGPTYQTSIQGGAVDTPTTKGTGGSVAAAGATISFGSVGYAKSQTIYLALQNTTTDANGGNALLTDLTIDQFTITGANAAQFSVGSLSPGSIITEGGTLLVPITVVGTSTVGVLNSTLTIFTDESTALGGAGDTFTYALTAMSVPEPTSLAVLGAGLAGLASFRRRRRGA